MSSTAPEPAPDPLTPVHEAARLLGGSPALYVALLAGGLIEGELRDGVWHVDTGVVGAALAVPERGSAITQKTRSTSHDIAADKMVGGAA